MSSTPPRGRPISRASPFGGRALPPGRGRGVPPTRGAPTARASTSMQNLKRAGNVTRKPPSLPEKMASEARGLSLSDRLPTKPKQFDRNAASVLITKKDASNITSTTLSKSQPSSPEDEETTTKPQAKPLIKPKSTSPSPQKSPEPQEKGELTVQMLFDMIQKEREARIKLTNQIKLVEEKIEQLESSKKN